VQLNNLARTDFEYYSASASLLHDKPDQPVGDGADEQSSAASGEPLDGSATAPERISLSALEAAAAMAASREGTAWREQVAGSKGSLTQALQLAAELSGVPRESILESAGQMLESLDSKLREAHASVTGMRRRLKRASAESEEGRAAVSSTGVTDESGTRVEWGHELSRWTVESCASLDEIADTRRAALTGVESSRRADGGSGDGSDSGDGEKRVSDGGTRRAALTGVESSRRADADSGDAEKRADRDSGDGEKRGRDGDSKSRAADGDSFVLTGAREGAVSLLEAMGPVWRVDSEAEAERQLLSYAAVATLPTNERVLALSMTSTTERLLHALCALRVSERRLAALLALRQVETPPPGDEKEE
jgi:hypothetical protein